MYLVAVDDCRFTMDLSGFNYRRLKETINLICSNRYVKHMTTPALPHEPDDPENTFLRDNSRKKTYAKAIQDANMEEARYGVGDEDKEELPNQEEDIEQQIQIDDTQPGADDRQTDDTWEIRLTPELKNQLEGPWKTSVILKLMGRPLGYRALQTRLVGI